MARTLRKDQNTPAPTSAVPTPQVQIDRTETFLDPNTETGLDPREEAFAQEYVYGPYAGNQTRSAQRAGYSPGNYQAAASTATNLKKRAPVAQRIADLLEERKERLASSRERVLEEYGKLAYQDLGEVFDFGEDGLPGLKDPRTIPAYARQAIKKIKVKRKVLVDAAGKATPFQDETVEVEMHDKKGALDKIGEHLGMFGDDDGREAVTFVVVVPERLDQQDWMAKYGRLSSPKK